MTSKIPYYLLTICIYSWFQPIYAQKWTHHRPKASLSISQARKAIKEEEHQPSFWPFFRTHFLAWIRCQLLYSSTTYIPCYSTMYDYIKSCISRLKSSHLLIVYKCKLTFTSLLINQGFMVMIYLHFVFSSGLIKSGINSSYAISA